jgi:UDP-glucose 4-epimerase
MKIFITGGLGQIGSHVAEMLLDRGDEVDVIDNLSTGRIEHLVQHPRLKVIIDTISNKDLVYDLIADLKSDLVVHDAESLLPNIWANNF